MVEEIPPGSSLIDISAQYNHNTIPRELLRFHSLPPEHWARIVVESGAVELTLAPPGQTRTARTGQPAVVGPGAPFRLAPTGQPARFHVEYYHEPRLSDPALLASGLGRR